MTLSHTWGARQGLGCPSPSGQLCSCRAQIAAGSCRDISWASLATRMPKEAVGEADFTPLQSRGPRDSPIIPGAPGVQQSSETETWCPAVAILGVSKHWGGLCIAHFSLPKAQLLCSRAAARAQPG